MRSAEQGQNVAVIGSGIAGLSAAWMIARRHDVTLFDHAARPGGHSNTIDVATRSGKLAVDTGFIVYNEATYPNLVALFEHFGVPTKASEMSFAVSLDGGALEYSGTDLAGLFAQPSNLLKPRFWSMLRDLLRFYREAPRRQWDGGTSLGAFLKQAGYGQAFREDHLLPMAAAIWSAPAHVLLDYPVEAFVRFFENHGLLKLRDRPIWRTVEGGSRVYVEKLLARCGTVRLNRRIVSIRRDAAGIAVRDEDRETRFDHVVLATHADQALALLADPNAAERTLLGAFRYTHNRAIVHGDATLMPKRRRAWASWNYLGRAGLDHDELCVTYWMNRLQSLPPEEDVFVTLNPTHPPAPSSIRHTEAYRHPLFDQAALSAQKRLWSLQGKRNTWFCGSYFGAGFHEDALQAGLAVGETLTDTPRPWRLADPSSRIVAQARPVLAATWS